MQQSIQYGEWVPTTSSGGGAAHNTGSTSMTKLVAENPVVVFARSGCCMCHVVKLLLHGHGVNPFIFDINEQNEAVVIQECSKKQEEKADRPQLPQQFPAVFVAGNLFGGLEDVVAAHISGELVPLLRKAGALWL